MAYTVLCPECRKTYVRKTWPKTWTAAMCPKCKRWVGTLKKRVAKSLR